MEMFKTLTSILLPGNNTIEFTDANITDTSILDCYLTDSELIIEDSSQIGTTVSITVSNHSEPVGVALFINNCDTFSPYDDTELQNELLQLGTRVSLLESSMNNKQDKLTAGNNITIENNVISASGGGGSTIKSATVTITSNAGGWFYLTDENNNELNTNNSVVLMVYVPYSDSVLDAYAGHISTESSKWICKLVGVNNNTVISNQVTKTLTILYMER